MRAPIPIPIPIWLSKKVGCGWPLSFLNEKRVKKGLKMNHRIFFFLLEALACLLKNKKKSGVNGY